MAQINYENIRFYLGPISTPHFHPPLASGQKGVNSKHLTKDADFFVLRYHKFQLRRAVRNGFYQLSLFSGLDYF